jgi:tRNA A37 threonylcarbamoyltransferase TsaD
LLDRQGPAPDGYAGAAVRGFVVKVNWSDVQPVEGGPIAANNAIDQAIAQARAVAAHSPGYGIKVRLYAGIYAPAWAKALGGPPVQVTNPQSGKSATVGRFWTDAYGDAYDTLQRKLAEKYDTVPEVREIVVSRCTTFFAEPFIRNKGNAQTVSNLFDAGFNTAADHRCHQKQLEAHQVWQHTRSDLELNPYQDIEQTGKASVDEVFTETMMQY